MTWDIGAVEAQATQPPIPIPPDPPTIPLVDVKVKLKPGLSVVLHHRRKANGIVDMTVDKGTTVTVEVG